MEAVLGRMDQNAPKKRIRIEWRVDLLEVETANISRGIFPSFVIVSTVVSGRISFLAVF
jgi:hypothetical protein